MDNLKRCPQCYLQPTVKVSALQTTVIDCERHGHMAMGSTVEQATEHWNRYITFIEKQKTA